MSDVGSALWGLFGPLGPWGGLVFIFLLFYIDAILIPTLPELFVVLVFVAQDHIASDWLLAYGVLMLLTIMLAEVVGVMSLYLIIKRAKLGSYREKVSRAVERYRRFLLVQDERMILLNRIAPILPFLGGFIALSSWNLRRSIIYVIIGGALKYGIILIMSGFFLAYFSQSTAQTVTMAMIIGILVASFIASTIRKRKVENANRTA
jgi:membrane protein YqaA with SNARE-associated domain